jgi:DNA-binding MarR family transcriptional regulator
MNAALATVLDLALARSIVVREVDADLGTFHGVSLADLALLLELREAPDGRMRRVDLANRLGVTTSGVARQLAPLERIGLVDREPHARDARLALVVLTEAGERISGEAERTASDTAARVLAERWSEGEVARLHTLLERIRT